METSQVRHMFHNVELNRQLHLLIIYDCTPNVKQKVQWVTLTTKLEVPLFALMDTNCMFPVSSSIHSSMFPSCDWCILSSLSSFCLKAGLLRQPYLLILYATLSTLGDSLLLSIQLGQAVMGLILSSYQIDIMQCTTVPSCKFDELTPMTSFVVMNQ